MIDILHSKKGTPFVWASQLHQELKIATPLRKWFPRMIEYGFIEDEDYYQMDKNVRLAQGGTNIKYEWAVKIDMAKHISMIQRSERGKVLRQYLLKLDNKVEEGQLLNHAQMSVLFDLCKVFGFFSVQKHLESEHHNKYEDKHENWWKYRARVLGQSSADLKSMMKTIGKKYESQRQALYHIDKYELIKRATFDLFKAMGKSDEFAVNVGTFAKQIANEIKPEIYDDNNMAIEFKSNEQKDIIKQIENRDESNGLLFNF